MPRNQQKYEFIDYLATSYREQTSERVPTLTDLSQELGVSVACLREQLEVARALGFVDARPRTGIRRLPYSFTPAVKQSVSYALELEKSHFDTFSDLRNHLEAAYWYEAVNALTEQDKNGLQGLLAQAWAKLRSPQIHIPHAEHRQLHLGIYGRLDNPFVMGILEAYWDAYESVGLNMYAGYDYLQQVWQYHQKMIDDICSGDYESGYKALIEHKDLLYYRPVAGIMGMDRTETNRSEKA
jgi:DNA-binding FadR family transcriptional regulator